MVALDLLLRRDPGAWNMLLNQDKELRQVKVLAVHEELVEYNEFARRYVLTLQDHPEPISMLGIETEAAEACFYQDIAPRLSFLVPHCWYSHVSGENGWIVLDEYADDIPSAAWSESDIGKIIRGMAMTHAAFNNRSYYLSYSGLHTAIASEKTQAERMTARHRHAEKKQNVIPIEEQIEDWDIGSDLDQILSAHAIRVAGPLANKLAEAAQGLEKLQSLGSWPDIIDEQHLLATADLLDDPLPILFPLRQMPQTLMHGNPAPPNWKLDIFEDIRLVNWGHAAIGPAVLDLVIFIDHFALQQSQDGQWHVRDNWPASEETMVDTYILVMGELLGSAFNATAFRNAIPAARCLTAILSWFPRLLRWFREDYIDQNLWSEMIKLDDKALSEAGFTNIVGMKPFIKYSFDRYLNAYHAL